MFSTLELAWWAFVNKILLLITVYMVMSLKVPQENDDDNLSHYTILETLGEGAFGKVVRSRKLPMEGVNSTWLLSKINNPNKKLVSKEELFTAFEISDAEVFITIGAGDIGELVKNIKKTLHEKN